MSNVKISELAEALNANIDPGTDVIIINDGTVTKKIKVDEFLVAAGTAISGNLIPVTVGDATTSSFDLGSPTAAWQELYVATSSINFVASDGVITKFTKADVANLKEGKSLRTGSKQIVHESDDTTFVQMKSSAPGRVRHLVSDVALFDMTTGSFQIGDSTVPLILRSNTFSITGSTSNTGSFDNSGSFNNEGSSLFTGSFDISGSTTVSGSFTVTDLLNVLADYNQTGSFSISGSTTLAVDVNMDGAVNVQDLLTVLAGFNASGSSTNTGSFSNSGSFSSEGDSTFTGSFGSSGSFDVDGNTTITGSFDQSGSFNSEGSSSFTGSINVTGSRFDIDTSAVIFNSLPTSDPGISGQVFTTGSTGMNLGGITGSGTFRIVCISGG